MKKPGFEIYLVGGAVRDQLLNRVVTEYDWVVVGATPEQMLALGYRQVGKDFPVFLHPETKEEYALARTERKTGRGYKGFVCYAQPDVTIEQDLLRRDLTINAMAKTPEGKVIDPYGGQHDLQQRILRHVSAAFVEDPLRVLRVARFYARYADLGFRVADETLLLMREMSDSGELDALTPERVWQELNRVLQENQPQHFFYLLRECGALNKLFPEIDNLFGVPNPVEWHPEIDTGIHTMMVLEQAVRLSKESIVRFAALMHDVGKALTPSEQWPSHHGHEAAGVPLIQQFARRYAIPRDYEELAILVSQYHGQCHRVLKLDAETILQLLEQLDAFRRPARFKQFLLACEADARGRLGLSEQPYPQSAYLAGAYEAVRQVNTENLLKAGLEGSQIAAAIKEQRLKQLNIYQLIDNKDRKHGK